MYSGDGELVVPCRWSGCSERCLGWCPLPEGQDVVEHGQEVVDVVLGYGAILLVLLPPLHEGFPQTATQPESHGGQGPCHKRLEQGCSCGSWGCMRCPQPSLAPSSPATGR